MPFKLINQLTNQSNNNTKKDRIIDVLSCTSVEDQSVVYIRSASDLRLLLPVIPLRNTMSVFAEIQHLFENLLYKIGIQYFFKYKKIFMINKSCKYSDDYFNS